MPTENQFIRFNATPLYDNYEQRWQQNKLLYPSRIHTSLMGQSLHKEEGSGMALWLNLFCWNAINVCALAFCYACFTLCGDTLLTTAQGLHAAHSMPMCQMSTVVVCTCISRSCCGCKICIFMFPRISGEKNNSRRSNGAVSDPSCLWRGSTTRLDAHRIIILIHVL